jgi:arylformamidase
MKKHAWSRLALIPIALLAFRPSAISADLPPPDFANMRYGPFERNLLDLWQAKAPGPRPLLVYIHGGGWDAGDKSAVKIAPYRKDLLGVMLQQGISVASVNYRYSHMASLPAPVYDAARAIQFLRSRAQALNLKKDRVAATGASAGGCTSLWLAYHPDLANPSSGDPVERESTRLCAAYAVNPQTSIDPRDILGWVGDQVMNHQMIWRSVGAKSRQDALAHYDRFQSLYRAFSPINFVSRDGAPVLLIYGTAWSVLPAKTPGEAIHHPILGLKLKEKADAVGAICILTIEDPADPALASPFEFLSKYLMAR